MFSLIYTCSLTIIIFNVVGGCNCEDYYSIIKFYKELDIILTFILRIVFNRNKNIFVPHAFLFMYCDCF